MFNRIIYLSVILLAIFTGVTTAQTVVIKAGKLVNPQTAETLSNQIIIIKNGKIEEIGESLKIPENSQIIDLSKQTILPGLFDAHTHLCAKVRIETDRLGLDFLDLVLLDPAGYRAIQGVVYAKEMLNAGFTTVRDVGNSGKYVDVDLKRAIDEGLIDGPTMRVSGRIIAPFGGQFRTRADKQHLDTPEYFFADTQDELKKAIRENIYYGANLIKIVADGQKYSYSLDDLKFIVNEAARANVKVAVHCQTVACERNAAEAGVASIEHGWSLREPEVLATMKKNNVSLVSTDFTPIVLSAFGWDETNAKRINNLRIERLKRAYQGSVNIVFGTDVMVDVKGETRGSLAISYIDSFVSAGIPTKVILQAMTTNAAQLLGVEKERGLITKGMAADIIAVSENPLENIQTLKNVNFVMKNGKVIKNTK